MALGYHSTGTSLLRRFFLFIFIALAVSSLLFSILSDLSTIRNSPMVHLSGVQSVLTPTLLTFFETVLPLVFIFGLYKNSLIHHPMSISSSEFYSVLKKKFRDGLAGLWLFIVAFLLMGATLLDTYFVFSAAPFTVSICGIIWLSLGLWLMKPIRLLPRLILLALSLFLILSVKYIDLNSRKPFVRDLLKIHSGMTVNEVDRIMRGYIKGTGLPSPYNLEDELTFNDELIYRHATAGPFYSDWGIVGFKDGKVERVEFQAD